MEIKFKKMELKDDEITVKIIGEAFGHKINMKISILQLAKIFGTDQKVGEECESIGFGSFELEEKCEETRELIKKFPNIINGWTKEIKFDYVSVEDGLWKDRSKDPNIIWIFAEDLVGWDNEGILIDFPKEIYDKMLKGKEFEVFVRPLSLVLSIKDKS
jgi:hypothetical protein